MYYSLIYTFRNFFSFSFQIWLVSFVRLSFFFVLYWSSIGGSRKWWFVFLLFLFSCSVNIFWFRYIFWCRIFSFVFVLTKCSGTGDTWSNILLDVTRSFVSDVNEWVEVGVSGRRSIWFDLSWGSVSVTASSPCCFSVSSRVVVWAIGLTSINA